MKLRLAGCLLMFAGAAAAVETRAPGDGVSPAWPVMQREIDGLSAAGGGTLDVPAGSYLTAQLKLRDNVTLHLRTGAVLLASTNHADYGVGFREYGRRAIVCARDARNVAVTGNGTINGRGGFDRVGDEGPDRWRSLHFLRCRDVRLEGVTFRDSNYWTAYFDRCDGVVVRDVSIRSATNYNNDGLDIESRNVLVERCDIDSDDDAICFKSDDANFVVERCEVRDCLVSSHCNFIKFGTASHGIFRDINIHDCRVFARSAGLRDWTKNGQNVPDRTWGISGIALEVVDGGGLERVTVKDITFGNGVICPLFIRLGERRLHPELRQPYLRDVLIENVRHLPGAYSLQPVFISGVPGRRIDGVTLRNAAFAFKARGQAGDEGIVVPEREKVYPEIHNFAPKFPCVGAFIRHARDIRFEAVDLRTVGGLDPRPMVASNDVERVEFTEAGR